MKNNDTAIVKKDGDWWLGWLKEVPGVIAQERTSKELMVSLREALRDILEPNRADARPAAQGRISGGFHRGTKRRELLRHLTAHDCRLLQEGGRHSRWQELTTRRKSAIPRHAEINDLLARKICRDLGVPQP